MAGYILTRLPGIEGVQIDTDGEIFNTELIMAAGTEARHELQTLFGTTVHLDLRVVVEPDWQRRPEMLDRLGWSGDH